MDRRQSSAVVLDQSIELPLGAFRVSVFASAVRIDKIDETQFFIEQAVAGCFSIDRFCIRDLSSSLNQPPRRCARFVFKMAS
jgi:hypothetical protein